jgi:hypothetical protein
MVRLRLSWRDWALLGIVAMIAFLVWWGGQKREQLFRRADHSACVRIEALKVGFRDSLERGLATLDSYQYYRDHPAEKTRVVEEIRRQLQLYAPITC